MHYHDLIERARASLGLLVRYECDSGYYCWQHEIEYDEDDAVEPPAAPIPASVFL